MHAKTCYTDFNGWWYYHSLPEETPMQISVQPVNVPSIKEACITQLETLILSGELQMGERLPSERELAAQLAVSRPILHEALVDLEAKGLLSIIPRRGAFINDFRRSGSLAILSSLMNYHDNNLEANFSRSLIEMRFLVEIETARLAAKNRTQAHLDEFTQIIHAESQTPCSDIQSLIDLDFAFHHLVAIASGNLLYPLILNSFRAVYTSLTGQFFQNNCNNNILQSVHQYHQRLVQAIHDQSSVNSVQLMIEMLKHGEIYLKGDAQ
jgi:GntR family transcriptional regulator, transcriptional repressor for pyruvate dehydrogenase complex